MKKIRINNNYLIGFLFIISFLTYSRALKYDFLWDDERSHLSQHEDLMKGNLKSIWTKPYDGLYIPVAYTAWYSIKTFSQDHKNQKLNPRPFHFSNILIHSMNGVLLFFVLFILFNNSAAAFLGSLLFIVHPLQVESVVWISEFRGLLSCFFGLLATLLFLKKVIQFENKNSRAILFSKEFSLSTLFYICAILSKPSAIAFPIIIPLFVWCCYSFPFKNTYKIMIAWFVLFIPIAFLTGISQPNTILTFVAPISERLFLFSYSAWFYITKFTIPLKLVGCYGLTPQIILAEPWIYIFSFIIIGLSIILYIKRERLKYLFTSYAIFLAAILPVSGFISFNYQRYSNVADRYMYLPMIGAAFLFAYFWKKSQQKNYFKIIIGFFIITCLILTNKQIQTWKSEFSMWNQSMENYPNQFMAAYNRGVQYGKIQKWQEAIKDYSIAISFNPKDKNTFVNRGNAYGTLNKYKLALNDYSDALLIDGNDGSIYYNRAITYFYLNELRYCREDIKKAISLKFPVDPNFIKEVQKQISKDQSRQTIYSN